MNEISDMLKFNGGIAPLPLPRRH